MTPNTDFIRGIIPAVVTPLTEDEELDEAGLRQLLDHLIEAGVHLFPFCPVHEIREDGLFIHYNRDLVFLKADTVVMAVGAKPDDRLARELEGAAPELYTIGDCNAAGDAMDAIHEGAILGRKI